MKRTRFLSLVLAIMMVLSSFTMAYADNNPSTSTELSAIKPFDGVAPEAQILGMKVFPSGDSGAATSDTLAAIEDAITLGADSINLSLGSAAGFSFYENYPDENLSPYEYEYTFAKARAAGILISASAGNENRIEGGLGSSYLYSRYALKYGVYEPYATNPDTSLVGSPSTKPSATSIASINNNSNYKEVLTLINGQNETEFAFLDNSKLGFSKKFDGQELQYVYCGLGRVPGDDEDNKSANDFDGKDLTGKIALIQRGTNAFSKKSINAAAAGAVGCILFNNQSGTISPLLDGITIPTIMLSQADGKMLVAAESSAKIRVEEGKKSIITVGNNVMSDFSSWGVTPDLKLKPEITAPGGQIYSSVLDLLRNPDTEEVIRDENGNFTITNLYDTYNGTSMSAPHVSGGIAIVREYVEKDSKFKNMTNEEKGNVIENLLMSTAVVAVNEANDDIPYSPRRQGAGIMNLEGAISSNAYLYNKDTKKSKVEVKEVEDNFEFSFDIVNMSGNALEYELTGSILTDGISYGKLISMDGQRLSDSVMTVDSDTTNVNTTGSGITISANPNETKKVTVKISLNSDEVSAISKVFTNGFFVEGFVELKGKNGATDLSIPYMGFHGSWRKAPIFDDSYTYWNYDDETDPFYAADDYWGRGNSGVLVCEDPTKYAVAEDFFDTVYGASIDDLKSILGKYNGKEENFTNDFISGLSDAYGDINWIAFSPNGDNYIFPKLHLMRNAREVNARIEDANGNVIKEFEKGIYYNKEYIKSSNGKLTATQLPSWDGTSDKNKYYSVKDGQYYYVVDGYLDYNFKEGSKPDDTKKYPILVDTVNPEFTGTFDSKTKTITINATDNNYVLKAVASDPNGGVTYPKKVMPLIDEVFNDPQIGYIVQILFGGIYDEFASYKIKDEVILEELDKTGEMILDVSDFTGPTAYVEVYDSAGNIQSLEVDIVRSNDFTTTPDTVDVTVIHEFYTYNSNTAIKYLDYSKTEVIKNQTVGTTFTAIEASIHSNDPYSLNKDENGNDINKSIVVSKNSTKNIIKLSYSRTDDDYIPNTKNTSDVNVIHDYSTIVNNKYVSDAIITELYKYQAIGTTFTAIKADKIKYNTTTYALDPTDQELSIKVNKYDNLINLLYSYNKPTNASGQNGQNSNFEITAEMLASLNDFSKLNSKKLGISKASKNDDVSIIVELDEIPLLARPDAIKQGGKSYLQTNVAQSIKLDMINTQETVKKMISQIVNSDLEFNYSYVNVFNGFATTVKVKDLGKIKSIPGVKNIYFDQVYQVPSIEKSELAPQMITSGDMIGIEGIRNLGYKGEGRVVAVIDTGVYVEHEIMRISDNTSVALDQAKIEKLLPQLNASKRGISVKVEDVYQGRKFPFCFDYADMDTDAVADGSPHGVHVAGTIAANGLSYNVEEDPQDPQDPQDPGTGGGGGTPAPGPTPGGGGGGGTTPTTPEEPVDDKPEVPTPVLPEEPVKAVDGFEDVTPDDWFYNDVKFMVENGLMNGVSDTKFAPNDLTTRAMIATIIHRIAGKPASDKVLEFEDVIDTDWFANAVKWTNEVDIVRGVSLTKFAPNRNITREQLATMAYRYVVAIGKGYEEGWTYDLAFDDKDSIGTWAYDAVCWMNQNGIIKGKPGNVFDPQANATRAEVSAVFTRLLNLLTK